MKKRMINTEKIAGYVYSHSLEKKESGPNSKNPGTVYIAGDLNVAVDEAGLNVITVHFSYVTEVFAKSGKTNNTYKVLEQIIDAVGRTWLEGGKDNALKVKVDTSLALNDFIGRDGNPVAAKRNEGGFVSIVNELPKERNTFEMDMVINKVRRVEADEERHIPKDYVAVGGAVFDFRNALLPVEFVVRNPGGMNYFESLDVSGREPMFTKVWGLINSISEEVESNEESADWGEASVRKFTRTSREWLITGNAKVPYDFGDEEILTADELKKAIQDREIYLAEVKKRQEEYEASRGAVSAAPVAKDGEYNF